MGSLEQISIIAWIHKRLNNTPPFISDSIMAMVRLAIMMTIVVIMMPMVLFSTKGKTNA